MKLPDIEIVSSKVHEDWMNTKLSMGVTTRCAEDGEELMVPYEQLTEKAKSLDRNTVKAVYAAIESAPPQPSTIPVVDYEKEAITISRNIYHEDFPNGRFSKDIIIKAIQKGIIRAHQMSSPSDQKEPLMGELVNKIVIDGLNVPELNELYIVNRR